MSAGAGDTPSSNKLKVREFDLVNYLETPADVAAYLGAWLTKTEMILTSCRWR